MQPHFRFPTPEKRRFEETKAGNAALWVALGLSAIVIVARFACVAFTGSAW